MASNNYAFGSPAQNQSQARPNAYNNNTNVDEDTFDPTPYDYAPYQPYAQPYQANDHTRAPPPSGPPPAYYRVINKTYSGSLRPIVLLTCFISLIFLVLLGVEDFKVAAERDISGKYKTFTVIQGILFMAAAALELFGIFSTWTQRQPLARLYSWLSLVAFGATIASEILSIIVLFTLKTDVIQSCSKYYQSRRTSDNYGSFWDDNANLTQMTPADADAFCQKIWSRSRTWDIIWLIVTTIVGIIFVLFGFAYARQLSDPNSVRSKINVAAQQSHQQHNYPQAYGGSGSGNAYDPESQYSYPPPPAGVNRAPYAPPSDAPPEYKRRPSLDDDVDYDAKYSGANSGAEYGYNYGRQPYEYERNVERSNRPGSSRGVRPAGDDDDDHEARRESGETLRGDAAGKETGKGATSPSEDDQEGPHTARI